MLLEGMSERHETPKIKEVTTDESSSCLEWLSPSSDHLGSLLILLEHSMSCLLENDSCSSNMTPDEVGSLITSIRGVSSNMIDFLYLQNRSQEDEEEQEPKLLHSSTTTFSLDPLSLIRFLCMFLVEDTDVTEEQADHITPVILNAFVSQTQDPKMHSPSFQHGILAALMSLNDVKEVTIQEEGLRETLNSFTSTCESCREGHQDNLPICQEFRSKILLK